MSLSPPFFARRALPLGLMLLAGCGTTGKKALPDSGIGVDAATSDVRDAGTDGATETGTDGTTDKTGPTPDGMADATPDGMPDTAPGADATPSGPDAPDGGGGDSRPADASVVDATVLDTALLDAFVLDAPAGDGIVPDAATPPDVGGCLPSDAGLDGGCLVALPVFGTGVDNQGMVLAGGSVDPHYTLTQSAETSLPGPNAIVVTTIAEGYWLPQGPGSQSKWIAPSADQPYPGPPSPCNAAGTYVYRTTFDLTGFKTATARINGQWAADNAGVAIRLNGVSVGLSSPGYASWSTFVLESGLGAGINTLDFEINDQGCPNGLRVELGGTASLL